MTGALVMPNFWRDILAMAHLKKGAGGHLLKTGTGHLAKTCFDTTPCTDLSWPPASWPSNGFYEEYDVTFTQEWHIYGEAGCSGTPLLECSATTYTVRVKAGQAPASGACAWGKIYSDCMGGLSAAVTLKLVSGVWKVLPSPTPAVCVPTATQQTVASAKPTGAYDDVTVICAGPAAPPGGYAYCHSITTNISVAAVIP